MFIYPHLISDVANGTTRQAYNIGVHPASKTRLGYIIFVIWTSLFYYFYFFLRFTERINRCTALLFLFFLFIS